MEKNEERKKLLIELVLNQHGKFIEEFLIEKEIPYSGVKEVKKQRIISGLDEGKINEDDLLVFLDSYEEYGNQHVYLFNVTNSYLDFLANEEQFIQHLKERNRIDIFNNPNHILFPNTPTMISINYIEHEIKFKWAHGDKKLKKVREYEDADGFLHKVYEITRFRKIGLFVINVIKGEAMLAIPKLVSGSNYRDISKQYLNELSGIIDTNAFTEVSFTNICNRLERTNEIRKRQSNYRMRSGEQASFRSRGKKNDYAENRYIEQARSNLRNRGVDLGLYYWKENRYLSGDINTHIYSDDNRVAFMQQCKKEEVDYVLGKIRHYCR